MESLERPCVQYLIALHHFSIDLFQKLLSDASHLVLRSQLSRTVLYAVLCSPCHWRARMELYFLFLVNLRQWSAQCKRERFVVFQTKLCTFSSSSSSDVTAVNELKWVWTSNILPDTNPLHSPRRTEGSDIQTLWFAHSFWQDWANSKWSKMEANCTWIWCRLIGSCRPHRGHQLSRRSFAVSQDASLLPWLK